MAFGGSLYSFSFTSPVLLHAVANSSAIFCIFEGLNALDISDIGFWCMGVGINRSLHYVIWIH